MGVRIGKWRSGSPVHLLLALTAIELLSFVNNLVPWGVESVFIITTSRGFPKAGYRGLVISAQCQSQEVSVAADSEFTWVGVGDATGAGPLLLWESLLRSSCPSISPLEKRHLWRLVL